MKCKIRQSSAIKLVTQSMKPLFSSRIIAVVLALFSMLFMQLALAAYVCPGTQSREALLASMSNMEMPGCDGMDTEQAALCHAHAHDQGDNQTLDKADLPSVTPFIASQLLQTLAPAADFSSAIFSRYSTQFPAHSAAPPIAILHCCFRI